MFYNPLFEFGPWLIWVGKESYNKEIEDSDWFPFNDENYYLDEIRHVPFLPYKYRSSVVFYEVSINYSWNHPGPKEVHTYSIEGFTLPPPGVPCIVHHIEHFQYIKPRMKRKWVYKTSSIQEDLLSANEKSKEQPLIILQRLTEMEKDVSQKLETTVKLWELYVQQWR